MSYSNFNHFTGKKKPFQTPPRKKKCVVKVEKRHKNKYEAFSNNNTPKYTNGY